MGSILVLFLSNLYHLLRSVTIVSRKNFSMELEFLKKWGVAANIYIHSRAHILYFHNSFFILSHTKKRRYAFLSLNGPQLKFKSVCKMQVFRHFGAYFLTLILPPFLKILVQIQDFCNICTTNCYYYQKEARYSILHLFDLVSNSKLPKVCGFLGT